MFLTTLILLPMLNMGVENNVTTNLVKLSPAPSNVITLPQLTGRAPYVYTFPNCHSCHQNFVPFIIMVQPEQNLKKKKKKKVSKRQLLIKAILGAYNAFLDEKERQSIENKEKGDDDEE